MLTRRHIRVKVMQSIYAMQQNQSNDLDQELKFLTQSTAEMQHLYLLITALFTQLYTLANEQNQLMQKKYTATAEEKTFLRKLTNNLLLKSIAENTTLQETIETTKMNLWDINGEYVKIIYKKIIESDTYQQYSATKDSSFEEDKKFIIRIYEEIIAPDEKIYDYISDYNLTWSDDYPVINTFIIRLLNGLEPNSKESYLNPPLYKNADLKEFMTDLFKKTALNDSNFGQYIIDKPSKWDVERIAIIDQILLKMAICEFVKFPSIPIKVTINEYLEIAKEYSTDKSATFINGILNQVLLELQEKNQIKKIGRGLQ